MGNEKKKYGIADLLSIMDTLRGENGCPWDREQTHSSIRKDLLEEAYEVADAIDNASATDLCEELGDLLLQVVFHSNIAKTEDGFDFDDVCDGICRKLILRHPHVFGDVKVADSAEVLDNWDAIKKVEKHQESATDTLKSVPAAFPAAMRAQKVQKRAGKAAAALKPEKEIAAARMKVAVDAVSSGNKNAVGDMLFAAVALAAACGADAEEQLQAATNRFVCRFAETENSVEDISRISFPEGEKIWNGD